MSLDALDIMVSMLKSVVWSSASNRLEARSGEEVIKKAIPKLARGLSVRESINEAMNEIKSRLVYTGHRGD